MVVTNNSALANVSLLSVHGNNTLAVDLASTNKTTINSCPYIQSLHDPDLAVSSTFDLQQLSFGCRNMTAEGMVVPCDILISCNQPPSNGTTTRIQFLETWNQTQPPPDITMAPGVFETLANCANVSLELINTSPTDNITLYVGDLQALPYLFYTGTDVNFTSRLPTS